jgi:hypothetical protein
MGQKPARAAAIETAALTWRADIRGLSVRAGSTYLNLRLAKACSPVLVSLR